MPAPLIAPLIPPALNMLILLINAARKAKELSAEEFETVKRKINEEFDSLPVWGDL